MSDIDSTFTRSRIPSRTSPSKRLAWASLCQVLFNTNEFLSID